MTLLIIYPILTDFVSWLFFFLWICLGWNYSIRKHWLNNFKNPLPEQSKGIEKLLIKRCITCNFLHHLKGNFIIWKSLIKWNYPFYKKVNTNYVKNDNARVDFHILKLFWGLFRSPDSPARKIIKMFVITSNGEDYYAAPSTKLRN